MGKVYWIGREGCGFVKNCVVVCVMFSDFVKRVEYLFVYLNYLVC